MCTIVSQVPVWSDTTTYDAWSSRGLYPKRICRRGTRMPHCEYLVCPTVSMLDEQNSLSMRVTLETSQSLM